jgi:hypothetical protein
MAPTVFMVAEKPSLAQSIAQILSNGNVSLRSKHPYVVLGSRYYVDMPCNATLPMPLPELLCLRIYHEVASI